MKNNINMNSTKMISRHSRSLSSTEGWKLASRNLLCRLHCVSISPIVVFTFLFFYSCVVLWEFVNVLIQSSVTLLAATNNSPPLVLFLFSHLPFYILFCSKLNAWNRSQASLYCHKMTNQFPITVQKKAQKSNWQNGLTSKLVTRVYLPGF